MHVISHGDDGVLPAFAAAAQSGPALIVGPLTRDDVKSVLALALGRPRVLVLNQPEDGSQLPNDVYALTLSVDSDAKLLAGRMREDGARAIATRRRRRAAATPLQGRLRRGLGAFRRRPSPRLSI